MRETLSPPLVPCSAYFTIKCSSPLLQSCGSGVQESDPGGARGSPALPVAIPRALCFQAARVGCVSCPAVPGGCAVADRTGTMSRGHFVFTLFLGSPTPCRGSPAWSDSSVTAAVALYSPRQLQTPGIRCALGAQPGQRPATATSFWWGGQGSAGQGDNSSEATHYGVSTQLKLLINQLKEA